MQPRLEPRQLEHDIYLSKARSDWESVKVLILSSFIPRKEIYHVNTENWWDVGIIPCRISVPLS